MYGPQKCIFSAQIPSQLSAKALNTQYSDSHYSEEDILWWKDNLATQTPSSELDWIKELKREFRTSNSGVTKA